MEKSCIGYILAFFMGITVWFFVEKFFPNYRKGKPSPIWIPIEWIISGFLLAVCGMQDAANIAVFLPRELQLGEFVAFAGIIFLGLGFLFYLKGERIQDIVNKKTRVTDVRAATIVDLVYAVILFDFIMHSNMPMYTPWV